MKKDFTHTLSTGLVMPSACQKGFLAPETTTPSATERKSKATVNSHETSLQTNNQAKPSGSGYTNPYVTLTGAYCYVQASASK